MRNRASGRGSRPGVVSALEELHQHGSEDFAHFLLLVCSDRLLTLDPGHGRTIPTAWQRASSGRSRSEVSWEFLQEPGIAIGVAESGILHPLYVPNLAYFKPPFNERFTSLVYIRYNQMQTLDRSRLHVRNVPHPGPEDDRTRRPGRRELANSHRVGRTRINL